MAGYSLSDIKVAAPHEEPLLKKTIAETWVTMKRCNWDDTKFCTVNPTSVISFSQAKSVQTFFQSEGWFVTIKKADRNYIFDVYKPFED